MKDLSVGIGGFFIKAEGLGGGGEGIVASGVGAVAGSVVPQKYLAIYYGEGGGRRMRMTRGVRAFYFIYFCLCCTHPFPLPPLPTYTKSSTCMGLIQILK